MPRPNASIALLTERRYAASTAAPDDWYLGNILRDDGLLIAALAELGIAAERVDWSRADVDWSAYSLAVFRTTWDYFDRFAEFSAWLAQVQTQTRLCNDAATIHWNMDKHYLADLAARGLPIVPSRFVERGTTLRLRELLEAVGWDEAVIKPCVSGAARHTYRVNRASATEIEAVVQPLLAAEGFLVQPFMPAIQTSGEDTLMVFGGRYSHAIRKIAKPGDFRVQDDHGGTVHAHEPTLAQIELAERAMAACDPRPVYGRVDLVADELGGWSIMELELIEPELWLRYQPESAQKFARAIAAVLQ
jgi:glutathione synthase/RimK-type ligase-like ATP-grasp enzyme